ncbi:MAG: L,D-transpeptidase family protein [Bacillota bacterium]
MAAVIFLSLILSSCSSKPHDEWEEKDYKFGFSPEEFKKHLKDRLNSADSASGFSIAGLEYADSLKKFYSAEDYHPAVMKSFEDSLSVLSLANVMLNAKEHGLEPARYRYDMIIRELADFFEARKNGSNAAYSHMVNTELLLANSILRYSHDIRCGAVNPAKIYKRGYYLPLADSGKGSVLKPLYEKDLLRYLNSIQPKNQRYIKMQAALKRFERLEVRQWDSIPGFPFKPKMGEEYPALREIAERLSLLGYLEGGYVQSGSGVTYDSVLAKAVAKFQKAHGLKADGSLGKETIKKLNTPVKDYIENIKINLERFRWTTYADSARYILVNVPDFYLYAVENGAEKLKIKVCTGKKFTYNPNLSARKNAQNNLETPLLFGKIGYMILNPSWTVPINIVKKEIYGPSVRDIGYLSRKNFRVLRNGKPVSISSEELARYSPNKLPFTFVQRPGEGNALGKIKFMFDNNFSVYLHDTPTRAPFSQQSRAVSHGCVRVEKPFDLAGYILKDNSKWTADYVRLETGQKAEDTTAARDFKKYRNMLRREGADGKTTRINLKTKVQLYIDYFTAWVDDEGLLNLREDVYGRDEAVRKGL